MRFALIGAGRIGIMHARLLAGTPGVDELLVADAMPDRAETAAREVGEHRVPRRELGVAVAVGVPVAAGRVALVGARPLYEQGDDHHEQRDLARRRAPRVME